MIKVSRRRFLSPAAEAVAGVALAACGQTASPSVPPSGGNLAGTTNPTRSTGSTGSTAQPSSQVNTLGRQLPADAAPLARQVLTTMGQEFPSMEASKGRPTYGAYLTAESLVHMNEEYELLPGAAEKWSLSPDGLTWTFTIRQGMVWSDGKPLTAGDFEYAFQRMADPRTGYDLGFLWVDVKNYAEVAAGRLPPAAVGVKALDDRTLAITTVAPAPYFPRALIANTPSRRDLVEKYGEGWSTRPETQAASGPYKLQSWEKGKQVILVANPDYHGPAKGYYEKIVFLVGPFTAQLPAYERDEIDVLGSGYEFAATAGDTARIKADPVLSKQLHTYTDFTTWYLYLDSLTPSSPFASLKVRQAFSYAIDRAALVKSALGSGGVPAYAMLPPSFPAAQPEKLKSIQNFDPKLARQLIAEAGFPGGSGFPKQTLLLRDPSVPVKSAAEAIQAMVKEHLGITFDIQPLDWNGYMDRLGKLQVQFSLLSYQYDFVDPANLLSIWMYGLGRRHLWKNAEFDSLVTQANTTTGDEAKRTALYQRAEEVLVRDVGGIFLWHPIVTQLWKPWIKGKPVQPNKFGVTAWRGFRVGMSERDTYISNAKK